MSIANANIKYDCDNNNKRVDAPNKSKTHHSPAPDCPMKYSIASSIASSLTAGI